MLSCCHPPASRASTRTLDCPPANGQCVRPRVRARTLMRHSCGCLRRLNWSAGSAFCNEEVVGQCTALAFRRGTSCCRVGWPHASSPTRARPHPWPTLSLLQVPAAWFCESDARYMFTSTVPRRRLQLGYCWPHVAHVLASCTLLLQTVSTITCDRGGLTCPHSACLVCCHSDFRYKQRCTNKPHLHGGRYVTRACKVPTPTNMVIHPGAPFLRQPLHAHGFSRS